MIRRRLVLVPAIERPPGLSAREVAEQLYPHPRTRVEIPTRPRSPQTSRAPQLDTASGARSEQTFGHAQFTG